MGRDPAADGRILVQVVPLLRVRSLAARAFDYAVPPELEGALVPGDVVVVAFGRRRVRGVVVALGPSAELLSGRFASGRILPIRERTGERIPLDLLALAHRLASQFLAPLGACLQVVAPPAAPRAAAGRDVLWLERAGGAVADGGEPPSGDAARLLTQKQQQVLTAVPAGGAAFAEVARTAGVSRSVVNTLVARGLLMVTTRPADVGGAAGAVPTVALEESAAAGVVGAPVLTAEQEAALAALLTDLAAPVARRRLLWGVTGSGKTEVYLGLLAQVVARGGGAIVLVPEIALTAQTVARLRERLGDTVAVLHSGLSPGQRLRTYRRIAAGEARVVVGARSAVFAPVTDLCLVVVDETHDTSYKQEEEPRYDARTIAWWRAEANAGLLVEGSASPRVEDMALPDPPLRLLGRPAGAPLPRMEVVDMRREGGRRTLAPRSRAALSETLARGEQAIVLLNRRGYAAFVHCDACGHVIMCPRCELSLTYHRSERALLCHACGFRAEVPETCPVCHETGLSRGAPGTQRLVEELLRLVPRTRLFRLDSDVVTSGTRVDELLAGFAEAAPSVLVGTQMVAKGHDFPRVGLVVVADADTGLYSPDFRATERTFQLLTQVAGRSGRRREPGRVLVQTWNPDVPCIRMALARQEDAFYREELAIRERLGYPPFRSLIRVVAGSPQEERARAAAAYLVDRLRAHVPEDELRGPARLPRLRSVSRWQLLLAVRDPERGRHLVARALDQLRAPYARRGVDLIVDIDPQSLQ